MKPKKNIPTRPTGRFARSQLEITLSRHEQRRLNGLAAALGTAPEKAIHAILQNALGFGFPSGSLQHRVNDTSVEMKWAS